MHQYSLWMSCFCFLLFGIETRHKPLPLLQPWQACFLCKDSHCFLDNVEQKWAWSDNRENAWKIIKKTCFKNASIFRGKTIYFFKKKLRFLQKAWHPFHLQQFLEGYRQARMDSCEKCVFIKVLVPDNLYTELLKHQNVAEQIFVDKEILLRF